jgi:hypothetical protein
MAPGPTTGATGSPGTPPSQRGDAMIARWLVAALAGLLLPTAAAAAGGIVAIVEEVESKGAGVEAFETLEAGRVIGLAPGERLVLGYLAGCGREVVTGGEVTIGMDASVVRGGLVERTTIDCLGSDRLPAGSAAVEGAALVSRSLGAPPLPLLPHPQPVLLVTSPCPQARLERLEPRTTLLELAPGPHPIDTAGLLPPLPPGAYRLSCGERAVGFRIDPEARPGPAPLLRRLVRL